MRVPYLLWLLGFGLRVANAAESQVCTESELRAALQAGGEILFTCDTVIELTTPLKIEQDVVLDGGTHQVTLSGGDEVRIFEVAEGVSFTLKNIKVVNGKHLGADGYRDQTTGAMVHATEGFGGALVATNAVILIQSCVFSNNAAIGGDSWWPSFPSMLAEPAGAAGGAIFGEGCQLEISGSQFMTNQALLGRTDGAAGLSIEALGGAIRARGGSVQIRDSGFTQNRSMIAGGAVSVRDAQLLVDGCRFDSNATEVRSAGRFDNTPAASGRGGAVDIIGATASVTNSAFVGNVLGGGGGATPGGGVLFGGAVSSEERITVLDSTFLNNTIAGGGGFFPVTNCAGGALWTGKGAVISGSRFVGNKVVGGTVSFSANGFLSAPGSSFGGAIFSGRSLEISESAVVSNVVAGGLAFGISPESTSAGPAGNAQGSGIFAANLLLTNVSVAFNQASGRRPGLISGAMHLEDGMLMPESSIAFSTFGTNETKVLDYTDPMAPVVHSGFRHLTVNSNHSVTLSGTILSGGGTDSVDGEIMDGGYNISDGDLFTEPTSRNNSDAKLGPIGFYGGRTETIPVRTGSPAIDAVVTGGFPPTDQRGRARPYGAGADIGAYEVSPPFVAHGWARTDNDGETVTVVASGELVEADPSSGEFVGFFTTAGVLQPMSEEFVFFPGAVELTEGVEVFQVSFVGYRLEETAIERVPGEEEKLLITFAAAAEGEYQLQISEDLSSWTEDEVQNVPANGLFRTEIAPGVGHQFFRVKKL